MGTALTFLSSIDPTYGIGWLITVLVLPSGKEIWSFFKKWIKKREKNKAVNSFERISTIYSMLQILGTECKATRISIVSAHNGGGELKPSSPLNSTCLYEWISKPEYSSKEYIQSRPLLCEEVDTLIQLQSKKSLAFTDTNAPTPFRDSLTAKGFKSIAFHELGITAKSYHWLQIEARTDLNEAHIKDLIRGAANKISKSLI